MNMNHSFPTLEKKFYYDENMPSIYDNYNTRESVFEVGHDLGSNDPTILKCVKFDCSIIESEFGEVMNLDSVDPTNFDGCLSSLW